MRHRDTIYLIGFTLVLGYTTISDGGFPRRELNYSLLLLGLIIIFYWAFSRDRQPTKMDRWLFWPLLLLPCYIVFQFLPLPLRLLGIISPARAEHVEGLSRILPPVTTAALSLMPGATVAHFFRVAAYILVLLTVREITLRRKDHPWAAAVPILVVAAFEAALGLLQYWQGDLQMAQGTYRNHSHYADLLCMALPFAIMYAAVFARREQFSDRPVASSIFLGCLMLAVAVAIFLAIICSLSVSGFISCLASLAFMGILWTGRKMRTGWRWATAGAVVLLIILGFFFIPPDPMVVRVAGELELAEGSRTSLWGQALRLVPVYPVFGSGLGTFESALYQRSTILADYLIDYAHNDYLQLLVELGIAGFLIGAVLVVAVVRPAVRAALRDPRSERGALGIACTGALAAFLLHSFYNFNFYAPANALMAAAVSGISVALIRPQSKIHNP
jgi:O-antigen ligase